MSQAYKMEIDTLLVKRMISAQFPQWADHPVEKLESSGTDNSMFKLGSDMVIRLPRAEWGTGQVEKEQQWLPKLAPTLSLAIPTPLAMGKPDEGYPWQWSVYRWLEGENATVGRVVDSREAAVAMARFLTALQRVDTAGGPIAGKTGRGVPLAFRDEEVRSSIALLQGIIDTELAIAVWEAALHAPVWSGEPVWLHGDLHPGNLLIHEGQLSAVIDFGTLIVGDPACDLMVAWTFLTADSRPIFREAMSFDDATWARGSGWALSFGVIAYSYYIDKNPGLAAISRRAIDEVIADYRWMR